MNLNKQISTYILVTLGWSYTFWLIAAYISIKTSSFVVVRILHILGGLGPFLAVIYCVQSMGNWKEYIGRIKLRGISVHVWLMIIAPVIFSAAAAYFTFGRLEINSYFLNAGLVYPLFLLFFGPLPEELGWRGILFDGLSKKSFLKAQLITVCVWLTWHIPLFFISGSYQQGIGFATMDFYLWCAGLIFQSIILGYLYLISERNISSAILFHYFVNLAGEAFVKNTNSQVISVILYTLLAAFLIVISLRRKEFLT